MREKGEDEMAGQSSTNTALIPPPKITMISSIQHLPPYKSECFLRQKYLEEKLSTREIAAQIFSARSTVTRHLKAFGIPLRPEDEANQLRKTQLAYGEKRRNRELMTHQRELETIEKMRELREQGFSLRKIAQVLTAMKIPTKEGKARWHPFTIQRILGNIHPQESTENSESTAITQ